MHTWQRCLVAGVAAVSVAACSDGLTVVNDNSPDADRALNRPTDVENLIKASFSTAYGTTLGNANLYAQMICLGMENYSNLANFGMGTRSGIPRPPISNNRNNATAGENYGPYLGLHRAARAAALGLSRVNQPTFTFFPASPSQVARAKAFAHFVIGYSVGYAALAYDSVATPNPGDDLTLNAALPLVDAASAMTYALNELDSAIAYAGAMGTQTLTGWVDVGTAMSGAQFIRYVRGHKARFRANLPRDPAGAAGVDWVALEGDAAAFLTTFPNGFTMQLQPAAGFGMNWLINHYSSNSVNWHQIWGFWGFADTSGAYDAWLNTAVALRAPYVIATSDLRWPRGTTRAAQQAAPGTMIENRATGDDWFGDNLGNSQYRHIRTLALRNANIIGLYAYMPAGEIRMLQAEARYRQNNFTGAATLINVSRIANGLPAVNEITTTAATIVPGSANGCIPRTPQGPSFTAAACATLLEALKYEKRMETWFTHWGAWFFDGRRWGDLPEGTPVEWPVPYQEMDTRLQSFYSISGTTAKGTYGL